MYPENGSTCPGTEVFGVNVIGKARLSPEKIKLLGIESVKYGLVEIICEKERVVLPTLLIVISSVKEESCFTFPKFNSRVFGLKYAPYIIQVPVTNIVSVGTSPL